MDKKDKTWVLVLIIAVFLLVVLLTYKVGLSGNTQDSEPPFTDPTPVGNIIPAPVTF